MARKRTSNEQPLKEVIDDLLKIYKIEDKYRSAEVAEAYKRVVGGAVAKQTRNIFLKDGVLNLTIDSAIIKSEFSYSKKHLIDRINEDLEKKMIVDLRIY